MAIPHESSTRFRPRYVLYLFSRDLNGKLTRLNSVQLTFSMALVNNTTVESKRTNERTLNISVTYYPFVFAFPLNHTQLVLAWNCQPQIRICCFPGNNIGNVWHRSDFKWSSYGRKIILRELVGGVGNKAQIFIRNHPKVILDPLKVLKRDVQNRKKVRRLSPVVLDELKRSVTRTAERLRYISTRRTSEKNMNGNNR